MQLRIVTPPTVDPLELEVVKNHLKVDGAEDNTLISTLMKAALWAAEEATKRAFLTQTWRLYLDFATAKIELPRPPLQSIESIKTLSPTESIVDSTSDSCQAVLKIAGTNGFAAEDTIIIDRDGSREETKVVLSVQSGISLTLTTNLSEVHTADQADRVEKYTLVSRLNYTSFGSDNSPGIVQLRPGYTWPIHKGFASFIIEFKAGYGDERTDLPEKFTQGMLALIGHMYVNRGDEGVKKAAIEETLEIFFYPSRIRKI